MTESEGAPVHTPLPEGSGTVDVSKGLADLKIPGDLAIKMGKTSPGLCVFSHARHVDKKNPNCNTCHCGLVQDAADQRLTSRPTRRCEIAASAMTASRPSAFYKRRDAIPVTQEAE